MANVSLGVKGWAVQMDIITVTLLVSAFFYFIFATVWMGTTVGEVGLRAVTMVLAGMMFASFFRTFTFDFSLSKNEMRQLFTWTLISLAINLTINFALRKVMGAALDIPRSTAVFQGVGEEVLFRLWLFPWLYRMTRSDLLAAILTASAFTAMHFARYGADPLALMIVFGGGFILSYAVLQTRRLAAPMLGHCLINFLAG